MGRSRVPGKFSRYGLGQSTRKSVSDWIPINPDDGSWTYNDVANSDTHAPAVPVVASVSTTSAGIRFQNDKDAFDSHMHDTEESGARYHKLLTTDDGTVIKFSDTGWSIDFLIKRQVTNDDSGSISLLLSDSPADRETTMKWVGITYSNLANGQGKAYYGTQAGMNDNGHADSDRVMINITHALDTSAGNTDNVSIMCCSSFDKELGSANANNSDNTWKCWYRLNYTPQGVDPEYRVAGRGLDNR